MSAVLATDLRNQLAKAIQEARLVAEAGARKALEGLAVDRARAHASMEPERVTLRTRLRAHGRQLGDRRDRETGAQEIARLAHEVAYEHWHRMLFARFLAENQLLIEPESGVAISMGECEELARERGEDPWVLAGRFAERMLPRIFRPDDPALAVALAPETRQALELGSLIDPHALTRDESTRDLYVGEFSELEPLLTAALEREARDEDRVEAAVAAQGMARAAALLAGKYTLVVTNVPYLGRANQTNVLKAFAEEHHNEAKADLATIFVSRIFRWLGKDGTQAVVTPQNWLFLTSYRKLREKLLSVRTWNLVARLGPGAFETIGGHVVNVALEVLSAGKPEADREMAGIDVSAPRGERPILAREKGTLLRGHCSDELDSGAADGSLNLLVQADQFDNPDSRISLDQLDKGTPLEEHSECYQRIVTGDIERFTRKAWEVLAHTEEWVPYRRSNNTSDHYGDVSDILYWERGTGQLHRFAREARDQLHDMHESGNRAWGRHGVAINRIGELRAVPYYGEHFDNNVAVIFPSNDDEVATAILAFATSGVFPRSVRALDRTLKVTNRTLLKVPFDLERWAKAASSDFAAGFPQPFSKDPTQFVFHGHPAEAACGTALQVATARLLGYRWPPEHDAEMRLAEEARAWALRCREFDGFADEDGIVCLTATRGEAGAADRLRRLLAAAFGSDWSAAKERELLAAAAQSGRPAGSLEDWLRDRFFEEHCKLFHHRPFVWHVWDGRKDGFHALVSYHRLAGGGGEGRRTLEALTYSYLGDWITRQKAEQREGKEGADARLAAAQDLQAQLEKILEGEPPCDLFVRWKPLHRQPIGWEPDIDDGVRLNIRPFMRAELRTGGRKGAGLLRWKPNIHWRKDRGKEPQSLRPKVDFPWFWSCPGDGTIDARTDFPGAPTFDGHRWNDLHYTRATKRTARERATKEDVG